MNWDLLKKGFIDYSDIMRMSKKLGFPLNKRESELIIATNHLGNK